VADTQLDKPASRKTYISVSFEISSSLSYQHSTYICNNLKSAYGHTN